MEVTSVSKQFFTVEEYFKLEEASEVRHEFYKGRMYAMAGSTLRHNRLVRKIAALIESQPSNSRCGVFTESVKVEVIKDAYYPYPDVTLTCHPFDLQSQYIIRQPNLIVEVLSKSSVATDRGFKWQEYQKMPPLLYYLLVDQVKMAVELFARVEHTEQWTYQAFYKPEDVVVFPRLNFELTVGAIYDGIDFTMAEEETDTK